MLAFPPPLKVVPVYYGNGYTSLDRKMFMIPAVDARSSQRRLSFWQRFQYGGVQNICHYAQDFLLFSQETFCGAPRR